MKSLLTSTEGCSPGLLGAYIIFRMANRTEFLQEEVYIRNWYFLKVAVLQFPNKLPLFNYGELQSVLVKVINLAISIQIYGRIAYLLWGLSSAVSPTKAFIS